MENSQSVLNKFVTEEKIKALIYNNNTRPKVLPLLLLFTSIIFILSTCLIRFHSTNKLSYSSYSSVMLSTVMLFTVCMFYVPIFISSIHSPYFYTLGFILQIINIILYEEFIQMQNKDNNAIFISIILFQIIVFGLILYEYYYR